MGLFLVASPIGNLKDITLRALEVLERADLIYCEDTRVSSKLLSHYGIKTGLRSYHEHSPKQVLDEILSLLKEGKELCYLSDAGMPCISDPGKALVRLAIEHGLDYSILPGANAALSAFAISEFDSKRFSFGGFLERNSYRKELEEWKSLRHPIILYEAPHRIKTLLSEILEVLGDRRITVVRELTKIHESVLHDRVSALLEHEEILHPRGEFVLVIEGSREAKALLSSEDLLRIGKKRLEEGEKLSQIAKDLSKLGGMDRSEIYKELSKE